MTNVSDEIYEDTASLGRFYTYITASFGCGIAMIFLLCGSYALISPTNPETTIRVDKIISVDNIGADSRTTHADISWTVNNVNYSREEALPGIYYTGQTFAARYDPTNPNNIDMGMSTKYMGLIMFATAIFTMLIILDRLFLVTKSKAIASAEGVTGLYNSFR